jgi:hypothetical protein
MNPRCRENPVAASPPQHPGRTCNQIAPTAQTRESACTTRATYRPDAKYSRGHGGLAVAVYHQLVAMTHEPAGRHDPGQAVADSGTCCEDCTVTTAVSHDQRWLRAARFIRWLAWASLVWMTAEGVVGLIAGFAAGSIALVGWALGSSIEALASVIVVWRFTGSRTLSETAERRAQRAVAVSFWLLAPYMVVSHRWCKRQRT